MTRNRAWEWQLLGGGRSGPWCRSLSAAVAGRSLACRFLPLPGSWRTFTCAAPAVELPPAAVPTEVLAGTMPEVLAIDGALYQRGELDADRAGVVAIEALAGPPAHGREAWLFSRWEVAQDGRVRFHLGADYWLQWFVDGVLLLDTLATGNQGPLLGRAWETECRLAAGPHVLCARVRSGSAGWAFAGSASLRTGNRIPAFTIACRRRFEVADPTRFAGLELRGDGRSELRLNGRRLRGPLPGVRSRVIHGLPATLLREGANELGRQWGPAAALAGARLIGLRGFHASGRSQRLAASGDLWGLPAAAARILSRPVLGLADSTSATVACRTNLRVPVTLAIAGATITSRPGLFHHLRLVGLPAGRSLRPTLQPGAGHKRSLRLRTLPADGALRVAVYGDPSPYPARLARVFAVMQADAPDLALALGDLTASGHDADGWEREYLALQPPFVATTPHLWIPGNHEEGGPLFARLLPLPGGAMPWSVAVRGCRFIGLDGLDDWSPDSAAVRWLDSALAAASEPWVIVANHYPAWSSTGHGAADAAGQPLQRTVQQAREVIAPLCVRHRVSCLLSGHAHCYERSLTPEGLLCITSGGAGGRIYGGEGAGDWNPHSRLFVGRHHWCRLTIGDSCVLEAIDLEGAVLDHVVLPARHP